VEQFFILFTCPFRLLDAGIKPLIPAQAQGCKLHNTLDQGCTWASLAFHESASWTWAACKGQLAHDDDKAGYAPASFTLLGGLANQKRWYASPLIQTIFHNSSFEDFILGKPASQQLELWRNQLEGHTSVFFQTPPLIIILILRFMQAQGQYTQVGRVLTLRILEQKS
jgi:hypothetical protein